MADCCNEFSRAALLRATAGQGLPAIEDGMPLPAGTGLTRRSFVARSVGLALAVYGAGRLDVFDEGIAAAATAAGANNRILVSVFLQGGADSLSMLYPDGDPLYRKLRPKLALPSGSGQPFAEDGRLRWHPSLTPLAQLHAEGKMTVLPSIGYDHPDQSHFTSRHYWEVGATDARMSTGWMGRYLDRAGTKDNPLQGLSLGGQLQPTLATTRVPVAAVSGLDGYDFWAPGVWGEVETRMLDALGTLGRAHHKDPAAASVTEVTAQVDRLRRQLAPFAKRDALGATMQYPQTKDQFPQRLAQLAAVIAAGLPLCCVAIEATGQYDTHADQPEELTQNLKVTADSLLAFQRDLEARGIADRVLTLVWSEFGRRAEENGSAGTDHGAAGTGFLIGTHATGKMVGEFPGLQTLDRDGNLRATSDFRGLYAGLLEQWLDFDAAGVIPNAPRFARPKLVR